MYSSKLLCTGSCVPEQIIDNEALTHLVDTNDEWIVSRTGISTRRISSGQDTSDLAAETARQLLNKSGLDPLEIDLILVATISPDYAIPSTACLVQNAIGAKNAMAYDLSAACSGFIFGLSTADKFIKCGTYKNVIVIGAEVLSKYTDWSDRTTCVLFGDGAAGALLQRSEEKTGILAENLGSDGSKGMGLTSGRATPSNPFNEVKREDNRYIFMDGRAIFEFATRQVPKSIKAVLESAGLSPEDISYVVPHQANSRIVEIIARKAKIPMEKFYLNISSFGNTSSASIPIALNEIEQKGMLKRGDKILLVGFGGGLTWGSIVIEY